ncbi:MAG: HAD family phosphatase [Bacteroidota bacterium]
MTTTIIFDLGKVLIHWDPRNLYRKIFTDEEEMEYFLREVCSPDWNEAQDAGRTWAEGVFLAQNQFPKYHKEIAAFEKRWPEMLDGAVEGTVDILKTIHSQQRHRLYALTNWSRETFPIARAQFDFLNLFAGILVSGEEMMKKPDPRIYQLLLDRYQITAKESVFIDDSERNVEGARKMGIPSILFVSPQQLKRDLLDFGVVL